MEGVEGMEIPLTVRFFAAHTLARRYGRYGLKVRIEHPIILLRWLTHH